MNKIIQLFIYCFLLLTILSCSSTKNNLVYKDTPYNVEVTASGTGDKRTVNVSELVGRAMRNPNNTLSHIKVFNLSIKANKYAVSLQALDELKRLKPADLRIDYNLACVFYKFGLLKPAKAKLNYVQAKSKDLILKNRSALLAIKIENKERINNEYFYLL
ncbi:MAG: hypothetical protein OCD76_21975 [Reichenbachiella sp.]